MVSLIPTLNVLFKQTKEVTVEPKYTTLVEIGKYSQNLLNYNITKITKESGEQYALLLVVSIVIIIFLIPKL